MTDDQAVTAAYDPAAPERWLQSRARARRRRLAEARAAARRRVGRRGTALVAAAMMLGAGGATAAQQSAQPAKPTARTGVSVLRLGSEGAAVAHLQRALGIPADGVFGRQTRRAVRIFQRKRGLAVDGIAGPVTLAALGLRSTPAAPAPAGDRSGILARIAACESGGNPRAVSPDGRYRGKYQFSRATWRGLGGTGDPAKAPEAEQDRRAAALLAREGTRPWPHCGRRAR
ncbi:MAG TPA: transglycosylase family protein [Solirubrobacteraceae bacterium]|nr:transglycosylase family protein [Solirubrobacteraceae bacterium]